MIYVGTCSWKYSSWEGLVYNVQSGEDMLSQYAKRYRTVEVDQWFWSLGRQSYGLPDPAVVLAYDQATDEEFRFTIKCPNALTLRCFIDSWSGLGRWCARQVYSCSNSHISTGVW